MKKKTEKNLEPLFSQTFKDNLWLYIKGKLAAQLTKDAVGYNASLIETVLKYKVTQDLPNLTPIKVMNPLTMEYKIIDDKRTLTKIHEDANIVLSAYEFFLEERIKACGKDRTHIKKLLEEDDPFESIRDVYNMLPYLDASMDISNPIGKQLFSSAARRARYFSTQAGFEQGDFLSKLKALPGKPRILSIGSGVCHELLPILSACGEQGVFFTGIDSDDNYTRENIQLTYQTDIGRFPKKSQVRIITDNALNIGKSVLVGEEFDVIILKNPLTHPLDPKKEFEYIIKHILPKIVSAKGALIYVSSAYKISLMNALALLGFDTTGITWADELVVTEELMQQSDRLVYHGNYNPLRFYNEANIAYARGDYKTAYDRANIHIQLYENTQHDQFIFSAIYCTAAYSAEAIWLNDQDPTLLRKALTYFEKGLVLMDREKCSPQSRLEVINRIKNLRNELSSLNIQDEIKPSDNPTSFFSNIGVYSQVQGFYDSLDYEEAETILTKYLAERSFEDEPNAYFMLAHCQLFSGIAQKNPVLVDNAKSTFTELLQLLPRKKYLITQLIIECQERAESFMPAKSPTL